MLQVILWTIKIDILFVFDLFLIVLIFILQTIHIGFLFFEIS